jgi:hypothetical protein
LKIINLNYLSDGTRLLDNLRDKDEGGRNPRAIRGRNKIHEKESLSWGRGVLKKKKVGGVLDSLYYQQVLCLLTQSVLFTTYVLQLLKLATSVPKLLRFKTLIHI